MSFWVPILDKFPALHVVIFHLGLPPVVEQPPSDSKARQALFEVLALSVYPGARIKLSGFYALSEPSHDYPYEAAWPYVKVLAEDFGTDRLLRASDFSPCLDTLTFFQTYGLFAKMPFLSNEDRKRESTWIIGLRLIIIGYPLIVGAPKIKINNERITPVRHRH